MCRFVLYLGEEIALSSLVTEPANSIIHQSYDSHERTQPLNGDGFGLAWYVPQVSPEPALFKDVTPAWNNVNLKHLARLTRSRCILAHVRAATPGLPVTQPNCHPFAWGSFAFMHNGQVAGFQELRRPLLERLSQEAFQLIQGTTDSEHVFALFVDHLRRQREASPLEAMGGALEGAVREVEELRRRTGIQKPSLLNLAVSDGVRAVACRYASLSDQPANSLYLARGRRYRCRDGVCRMEPASDENRACLIASEPLSGDPGWERIEPNQMVLVSADLELQLRPLAVA